MSNILDFLTNKEQQGYTIHVDPKEDNENGLVYEVITNTGNLEFVGLIGPKTLGEWIRKHAA
jgi:hypothetical protein